MAKVIILSRKFPKHHIRAGQETFFIEKYLAGVSGIFPFGNIVLRDHLGWLDYKREGMKLHTIRSGTRWKVGDMAAIRYWSDRPYKDPQVRDITPDVPIVKIYEIKTWDINIIRGAKPNFLTEIKASDDKYWKAISFSDLAKWDGLTYEDLLSWFRYPSEFHGQILCWSEKVNY